MINKKNNNYNLINKIIIKLNKFKYKNEKKIYYFIYL